MASRSMKRLEKSLASTKKRASDLRKKMKTEQPMVIGSTIIGGAVVPYVEQANPFSQFAWGQNPELLIGGALVAYGLTSSRSGQAEKIATAAGTGMLTVSAYKFSQQRGK
tara:strand:- start:706 stop:1035 length:330 start_codon:yes stop_codon:yes gene_type:complete